MKRNLIWGNYCRSGIFLFKIVSEKSSSSIVLPKKFILQVSKILFDEISFLFAGRSCAARTFGQRIII
jgi:hypothetical protein